MTREDVIAAARLWIGTPYRHQASVRGQGCDCLGLLRGVWRDCVGAEPEVVPPYSPDWAELSTRDTLLMAARRHLVACALDALRPGDVLLFRMGPGHPAKHCAILSRPARIIHAYWGRTVCETALVGWWQRRLVAGFSFPGLDPDQTRARPDPGRAGMGAA